MIIILLLCVASLTTQPEGTSLYAGFQCVAAYIMMWTDTISNADSNRSAVSNAGSNISVYNTISSPRSLSIVTSSIQPNLEGVFSSLRVFWAMESKWKFSTQNSLHAFTQYWRHAVLHARERKWRQCCMGNQEKTIIWWNLFKILQIKNGSLCRKKIRVSSTAKGGRSHLKATTL